MTSCQTLAEAARDARDYEAFHDLAWAAYRKGKSNDPELMLFVARAQSLSGRPGDALVMLERAAALGHVGDALTSEDFARVRALPRWPEVAEKLSSAATSAADAAPVVKPSAKDPAPPAKLPAPSAKAPAPVAKEPTPPAKDPAPAAKDPAPSAKDPAPSAKEPTPPAKDPTPSAKSPASSAKDSLPFTTLLTPDALAYDAVSRRFIIADRKARRVAVIDEHTGQVATLVGAQGALGEINGISIDPQQGDLWVISTGEDGPLLHRMQLISGRMLTTVPLSIENAITAMTWVPGSGLVVADAGGLVWAVRGDGKTQKLASLEYVPRRFAADARGRLYVDGGTPRLARFAVNSTLRKIDTVELDIPAGAPFAVSGNRLHVVVAAQGSFEIRSVPVK